MSASLASYDRLREQFSDEQARAILDAMTGDLVTREYFDGQVALLRADITGLRSDANGQLATLRSDLTTLRSDVAKQFAELKTDLTWRFLGLAGLLVVVIGLVDKFVRP